VGKTIIILLGKTDSGKSRTIKKFFGVKKIRGVTKKDGNPPIFTVVSSPQEMEKFCESDEVIKRIKKYLNEIKENDFIFILPFTIQRQNGRYNIDCILKPIEELKKNHNVHVIYLDKINRELDNLLTKANVEERIKSIEDYSAHATQLEKFIKNLLLAL